MRRGLPPPHGRGRSRYRRARATAAAEHAGIYRAMQPALEHHPSARQRGRRTVPPAQQAGAGVIAVGTYQEEKDRTRDRARGRRELSVYAHGGITKLVM